MKKALSLLLALVLCLPLCACGNSSKEYVGIWKNAKTGEYMYIYEDGTGDFYGSPTSPSYHYNAFTWELEDNYFVRRGSDAFGGAYVLKFTLDGDCLLDSQGKVAFRKYSNDPSVDIDVD